ncbi:MAG: hypothetical protein H6656_02560 [Ardenticatenaceae bacterium]|nr:hypothetical protein [Ardenticatenaceae bacterium]
MPVSLLNWESLGNNNVYNPTIQDLYLNGGWVEFSYTPGPNSKTWTLPSSAFTDAAI